MNYHKKLFSEDDLYTLEQCTQRYVYDKEKNVKQPHFGIEMRLIEEAILEISNEFIVNEKSINPVDAYYKAFDIIKNEFDITSIEACRLSSLADFNKILKELSLSLILPIKTNLYNNVDCLKSIKVKTKFLLLAESTKSKTIRAIVVSPYLNEHEISWSVVHRLQYEALKSYHKEFSKESERHRSPNLYIIYYNKGWRIFTMNKSSPTDMWKSKLSLIGEMSKKGFHYPIVPCRLECVHKKRCFPQ